LTTTLLLLAAGLIAGLIDSIAGGGGLITVPSFVLVLGPGVTAIATNKIAGVASAGVALLIYMKNGHVTLRGQAVFALLVGIGAWLGSVLAPLFPPLAFKYLLFVICPLILFVVWRKDLWVKERSLLPVAHWRLWIAGFFCGLYDGIAGPGGGTLMFLSLLFFGRMPLLGAMGTAKLANLTSAGVSLVSYASQGLVQWRTGAVVGASIAVGAVIGAEFGNRRAVTAVRLALTIVVTLLLVRLATAT
jgi:uncharacterized protein